MKSVVINEIILQQKSLTFNFYHMNIVKNKHASDTRRDTLFANLDWVAQTLIKFRFQLKLN
jgi:hypothetical protein